MDPNNNNGGVPVDPNQPSTPPAEPVSEPTPVQQEPTVPETPVSEPSAEPQPAAPYGNPDPSQDQGNGSDQGGIPPAA